MLTSFLGFIKEYGILSGIVGAVIAAIAAWIIAKKYTARGNVINANKMSGSRNSIIGGDSHVKSGNIDKNKQ